MQRRVRITEQSIKTLRGAPGLYRDGALLVRVSKGGTVAFCVQVDARRNGGHVSKRRTLGRWPEMSVATARSLVEAERVSLRADAAPVAVRVEQTLADAWHEYLAAFDKKDRSQKTRSDYLEMFESLLAPGWGTWTWSALCSDEGAEAVRDAHAALPPYRANRACELLRAIHRYAVKMRPRTVPVESPVRMVLWNNERRGVARQAMALDELPGWYQDVVALPDVHRRRFHLAVLLTGSRPAALAVARWEHVDLERRVWHLPCPKGGSRAAYDVPITAPLERVLREARGLSPWVFSSTGAVGHLESWRDRPLRGRCGKVLRRVYRTHGERVALPHVVEALLGHRQGQLAFRYRDLGAVWSVYAEGAERIAELLWAACQGAELRQTG